MKRMLKKTFGKGLTVEERLKMVQEKPIVRIMYDQWENAPQYHLVDKINSHELWKSIQKKNFPSEYCKREIYHLGYSIAAAVIVILLLGTWMTHTLINPYTTIVCKDNEKIVVSLPDSSKVWMNSGCILRYNKKFINDRNIELQGEAFFSVRKMNNCPFKVHMGEVCVEVKGTEFNVLSNKSKIEITLFSGLVAFSYKKNKEILMSPHEQIIYDSNSNCLSKKYVDAAEYDWRFNEYSFSQKSLKELVLFLNRTYNIQIKIANKQQENILFTGKIRRTESLYEIIDKICISFNLKYKKYNNEIILYE